LQLEKKGEKKRWGEEGLRPILSSKEKKDEGGLLSIPLFQGEDLRERKKNGKKVNCDLATRGP